MDHDTEVYAPFGDLSLECDLENLFAIEELEDEQFRTRMFECQLDEQLARGMTLQVAI